MPEAAAIQTVPSVQDVCFMLCICMFTKQPQALLSGLWVNQSQAFASGTSLRNVEIFFKILGF